MSSTEKMSAVLRPLRSASPPSSKPPIGRTRKPIANTAAVFMSCTVRLPDGKNTGAKYNENEAYTYQSKYSTRLPAEPLTMDLRGAAEEGRRRIAGDDRRNDARLPVNRELLIVACDPRRRLSRQPYGQRGVAIGRMRGDIAAVRFDNL